MKLALTVQWSRFGFCRHKEVMGKLLGCGCTFLSSFPLFSGMTTLLGLKAPFSLTFIHFGTQTEKSIFMGNRTVCVGSPAPASVPPPPWQAWSQALRPACLNIRFNWGLPAYQRQHGNFCEGKGLPRCWPDLSLLSLLHNLVLSHHHFPPSERLRLLSAVFV